MPTAPRAVPRCGGGGSGRLHCKRPTGIEPLHQCPVEIRLLQIHVDGFGFISRRLTMELYEVRGAHRVTRFSIPKREIKPNITSGRYSPSMTAQRAASSNNYSLGTLWIRQQSPALTHNTTDKPLSSIQAPNAGDAPTNAPNMQNLTKWHRSLEPTKESISSSFRRAGGCSA